MTHKPTPDTIAEIAGKLTKRARHAVLALSNEWSLPTLATARRGCYSLHWGKSRGLGVTEQRWHEAGNWWDFRLTPLGLQVKAHLEQQP